MAEFRIETERLVLREWREDDAGAMYAIGQSHDVMAFLGPLTTREEARALVTGQIVNQALFGHCFWPIEGRSDGRLLGFCGLNPGPKATPMEGAIEIGWQLAHDVWGRGYAREAAQACLDWGWIHLAVDEIAATTVPANTRSRKLIERLGMRHCRVEDFDHPDIPPGNPLRRHLVYRMDRPLS